MPTESEQKEMEDYVNLLLETTQAGKVDLGKLKIVVDASSGPVAEVLKNVFSKISINAFPVNFDTDPALTEPFPDISGPDDFKDARAQVRALGADMGVVFDEVGERLALIDNMAQVVPSEYTLELLLQASDHAHDLGISGDAQGHYYFKEMGEKPQPILAFLKIVTSFSFAQAPLSEIIKQLRK